MNLIRVVISCCCLAGITTICQGQKFRDVSNLKTKYLKPETSQYEFSYKIPFKKIEVIDFRFDTSKIGYAIYHNTENHTKFVTPGGLQDFLNKRLNLYFKNNLDPSSSQTLFIVVKKLWLEYDATSKMLKHKSTDEDLPLSYPGKSLTSFSRNAVCLSDIDAFCFTDTAYQALARITYDFRINKPNDSSDGYLLLMPFDSLIEKIHSLDVPGTLATKTKFSLDQIKANYNKRFDIPVLFADSLNRGIFLTFDDFKNNKPAYPDFKFKIFDLSTQVTIEQNGEEIIITDYWGFADRKQLYIKPGFLTFKTLRQGNTFDFLGHMGSRNVKVYTSGGSALDMVLPTYHLYIYPMQIDMETGKVY
jgi:hypothetical protein